MKYSFATPALKDYILYLETNYPNYLQLIESYVPKFSTINLLQHNFSQETYKLPITLPNNSIVHIIWNIDSLIRFLLKRNAQTFQVSPSQIINHPLITIDKNAFHSLEEIVKKHLDEKFIYKSNFIIIAELSPFNGLAVIDGNHRLCHAYLKNDTNISVCFLEYQIAIKFLQPDSINFINMLTELHSIIHAT